MKNKFHILKKMKVVHVDMHSYCECMSTRTHIHTRKYNLIFLPQQFHFSLLARCSVL